MAGRGLNTTVQEIKTKAKKNNVEYLKYVTPIPVALIKLMGIKKGDKLVWNLNNGELTVKVVSP